MSTEIEITTAIIEDIYDKKSIINGLKTIGDDDFRGNNGDDYICEEAREKGFRSDQEYVIDKIMHQTFNDYIDLIQEYIDEWLQFNDYYITYKWELTFVDNNKTVLTVVGVYKA